MPKLQRYGVFLHSQFLVAEEIVNKIFEKGGPQRTFQFDSSFLVKGVNPKQRYLGNLHRYIRIFFRPILPCLQGPYPTHPPHRPER